MPVDTPIPARGVSWYQALIIQFADGAREFFYIDRSRSGTHRPRATGEPAAWTRLEHFQCPGCPLSSETRHCPAALSLEQTLDKLAGRISYEPVQATAIDERDESSKVLWPLQQVGAVFVQLATFAGGCPLGMKYKPLLAGLHPFATSKELGRHLVSRLLRLHGGAMDECRKELAEAVETLRNVLSHLCLRLTRGRGLSGDAVPNAIVSVDAFAQCLAMQVEELLTEICGKKN